MIHPILLFGATSILGYNLARLYPARVRPFVTPAARARRVRSWPALNLQDAAWIDSVFEEHRPEILLYCHAVCDVPKCEEALARPGSLVIRIGLPIGPSPDGRTGHRDWLRYRLDRNLPVTIVRDEYRSA